MYHSIASSRQQSTLMIAFLDSSSLVMSEHWPVQVMDWVQSVCCSSS